jgi:hypothetical protein
VQVGELRSWLCGVVGDGSLVPGLVTASNQHDNAGQEHGVAMLCRCLGGGGLAAAISSSDGLFVAAAASAVGAATSSEGVGIEARR